jgi:cyclase
VHAYVQPDGTWWVNNAGVVAGRVECFVVDTCATAERTCRFLDLAAEATGIETPRWAVNTHQHGDHSYGHSLLPSSTVLIGHEKMRAAFAVDPLIDQWLPVWSPVPNWGPVVPGHSPPLSAGDVPKVFGSLGKYYGLALETTGAGAVASGRARW